MLLSKIFDMLEIEETTCSQCKAQYRIPVGCNIQWESDGVEWVDIELKCDCDFADDAPIPYLRYDGTDIEFLMRALPEEQIIKRIAIDLDSDVDTLTWHRIGEHIGIAAPFYWHWSKEWHEQAERTKRKIDSGICPDCEGKLQMMGNDFFCLDCDFDSLIPGKCGGNNNNK